MTPPNAATIADLDAADPLRHFRTRFRLPPGVIYLDGNSLGALPVATAARMADVIAREWGDSLIRSWNDHDWIGAPRRIGDKIARLIGAAPGEVIVADSTSVNLFKLVVAATELCPDRGTILTEAGNFPTDLHVATRAAALLGKRMQVVETGALADAIGPDTALTVLSHVHYRSGHRHDMPGLTALARSRGSRIIWDLSHSAGAVPLALGADGVDLAIGCGYKYLNGGPGAPAFLYVAKALQPRMVSPIAGWLGHAAPFAFGDDYRPADGVERFLAGTPPMLSLLALETGVDLMLEADQAAIAAKARSLHDLFATLMAARCPALRRVSPDDAARRGSHISFAHPQAQAIVQAAIAAGVIGDFRAPDVARFGLTPLYTSHRDIDEAVERIAAIVADERWRDPRFTAPRGTVT